MTISRFSGLLDDDEFTPTQTREPEPIRMPDLFESPAETLSDAQARAGIKTIGVAHGGDAINILGLPGVYSGEHIATTSGIGGIRAENGESAGTRAIRMFGLDFDYRLETGYHKNRLGELVPNADDTRYVVRGDTDQAVGKRVVTPRFHLVQPSELASLMDAVGGSELVIDRGGLWGNGSTPWLQSRIGTIETPSGPAETSLVVSDGVCGNQSLSVWLTATVIICRNYYRSALNKADTRIKMRHTASIHAKMAAIRGTLAGAGERFAEVQKEFFSWGRKSITVDAVMSFVRDSGCFEVDNEKWDGGMSTQTRNQVDKFIDRYEHGPGADASLWGLAQAATNWTSHEYGSSNQTEDDRYESGWQGGALAFESKAMQHVRVMAMA